MMSHFNPAPKFGPKVHPRREPKATVPSYIGEEGLVACWLFYSGAGDTLYDFSGEGNHGDLNGPKWTDEGIATWGLDFDGADDYVHPPDFPTFDEYTVMVLTKHSSVNDGDYDDDCGLRSGNAILLRDGGGGSYECCHCDSGKTWHIISTPVSNDAWNLWTQRWDGSVMDGWKNDTKFDSVSVSSIFPFGTNVNLGRESSAAGHYLNGTQIFLLVFDVAKPDSFIKEVYEATKPLYT